MSHINLRSSLLLPLISLALLHPAPSQADAIQMLPPVDSIIATNPCTASVNGKVLTWDGTTSLKCQHNIVVDPVGNVGIGVASPQTPLALSGNMSIVNGSIGFNRNPADGSLPPGGSAALPRYQLSNGGARYFGMEAFSPVGSYLGGIYLDGSNGNVSLSGAPAQGRLNVGSQASDGGYPAFSVYDAGDVSVTGGSDSRWALYQQNAATGARTERIAIEPDGRVTVNDSLTAASYLAVSNSFFVNQAGDLVVSGGGNSTWGIYWGNAPAPAVISQMVGWDQSTRYFGIYGDYGKVSDRRLKENIKDLDIDALAILKKLTPVTYTWKSAENKTEQMGFIAQDIQKVLPNIVVVGPDTDKTLSVKYEQLIPVLVKAIQAQQAEIDELKAKLSMPKE